MDEKSLASIDQAKEAALRVLLHNARGPFQGLPRAAGWGYPEPYTRDLMISALGFLATGNEELADALRRTLSNTVFVRRQQYVLLGQRRHLRLQRQPQEHALCRPDVGPAGGGEGHQVRHEGSGRAGERTGQRARKRHHGAAIGRAEDQVDRRRDALAPQRLPSRRNAGECKRGEWRSGENHRGDAAARKLFFSSLRPGGEPLTPTPDP